MHSFDSAAVLLDAFVGRLEDTFLHVYGPLYPEHLNTLRTSAALSLETIVNTDALYHDAEHTMMVTMVGQQIALGKMLREGGVDPTDWVQYMVALLFHDVGYVRGICPGDSGNRCVVNDQGDMVEIPPGGTDAFLTPYHVERGKMFVRWRFRGNALVNCDFVRECIENTRFPVPNRNDAATDDWPGLVRAADLIGQMADPYYLRKLPALFHEFEETGTNARLGNRTPADLRRTYPSFFWNNVHAHIRGGLHYLEATREGRDWIASLLSHVFVEEHKDAPAPIQAFCGA
ncbi:MAG TPA: hypothetical protein VEB20_08575 [Azospirillaceae bacterium]|nr:hypothetical protein [Azospirillaceae bacterium]